MSLRVLKNVKQHLMLCLSKWAESSHWGRFWGTRGRTKQRKR